MLRVGGNTGVCIYNNLNPQQWLLPGAGRTAVIRRDVSISFFLRKRQRSKQIRRKPEQLYSGGDEEYGCGIIFWFIFFKFLKMNIALAGRTTSVNKMPGREGLKDPMSVPQFLSTASSALLVFP